MVTISVTLVWSEGRRIADLCTLSSIRNINNLPMFFFPGAAHLQSSIPRFPSISSRSASALYSPLIRYGYIIDECCLFDFALNCSPQLLPVLC